jgi:hypothetical protein
MNKSLAVLGVGLLLTACAREAQVASAPVFVPVPPPVAGKTKSLTEFTADDLRRTYGPPAAVRKEADAEMWRYDVGACRIFFFFSQTESGPLIRLYESLPPGKPGQMDPNCFSALQLRVKPTPAASS